MKARLTAAALATAFGLLAIAPANAATSKSAGLTISPLRSYPTQDPGVTTTSFVQISDVSKVPIEITLSTQLFSTIDENYDYAFAPVGSTNWIRLYATDITLAPKQTQKINYDVAVPANAKPGGYYFTIIATTELPTSTTNFTQLERVASLVYLQVSGSITHKVTLLGTDLAWFSINQNPLISARVANDGTSHDEAALVLSSRYLPFGKPSSSVLQGLILPATIHRLRGNVSLGFWPGIYRVSSTFSPVQGGTFKSSHYVLFVPIWFIVLIVLTIIYLGSHWRTIRGKFKRS